MTSTRFPLPHVFPGRLSALFLVFAVLTFIVGAVSFLLNDRWVALAAHSAFFLFFIPWTIFVVARLNSQRHNYIEVTATGITLVRQRSNVVVDFADIASVDPSCTHFPFQFMYWLPYNPKDPHIDVTLRSPVRRYGWPLRRLHLHAKDQAGLLSALRLATGETNPS